jgi:hypothetical protein
LNAGEGFNERDLQANTNIVTGSQNNPGSNQRYDFRGKPNDGQLPFQLREIGSNR